MVHPLVLQLRFTRSEFQRAIRDVGDEDARKRIPPMNCISWTVGHLAWQEQMCFLFYAQGRLPVPEVDTLYAYGAPASAPPIDEMWKAWDAITREVDPWLDSIASEKLRERVMRDGKPSKYIFGSLLQRVIYHY